MRKAMSRASAIEMNTGVDVFGAYSNEVGAFLGSGDKSVGRFFCEYYSTGISNAFLGLPY